MSLVFVAIVMFFAASIMSQDVYAQSTNYYVGGTGASDNNPGTSTEPFATIQKAATVATAGSIVNIRTGTYRETITPANSGGAGNPITYQPDAGATVIISGLNVVGTTGWTVHSGSIYKKTITLPVNGFNTSTTQNLYPGTTTIYANQLFKDGEMQFEARWPNISTFADLLDRSKYRQLSYPVFDVTTLTDAGLPLASPGLTGATLVSNGWFMTEARTVTQSGTQLTYGAIWDNTTAGSWSRKAYYLTGKLALLDAEKEWHYESGTLYFRQAGGGTPSGTIEHKARNWAFDGRGKSYISIVGLTFIGCDPFIGNSSSTNITIDNIRATYMNHHVRHDVWEWQGVGMSKQFGIKLLGANSVIKNSELSNSGSSGVWLGPNCRAENNLMHDMGYVGYWANPISLWDRDGGQIITYNTIYRVGRSCIDFGWNFGTAANPSQHLNVEIGYNYMHDFGMISGDVGATYTWGQCVLTGLNYHHNWIHSTRAPSIIGEGGIHVGIYFDQATGGGTIHHNVTWDCADSDIYHETTNGTAENGWYRNTGTILNIYNNTFASTNAPEPAADCAYRTYVSTPVDIQRNNIYVRKNIFNWGQGQSDVAYSVQQNLLGTPAGPDPQFVGGDINTLKGLYYKIGSGSPARNLGILIAGITPPGDNNPDAGAYEYGAADWIPGYVAVGGGGTVVTPTFSPVAGTYTSTQSVTISTTTSGATIRYTIDGSAPTGSSTLYSGAINISVTTTLKAIALKSGMTDSAVASGVYTINVGE